MPTYDYQCKACGHSFEEMQKITAEPLVKCPKCGKNTLNRKVGGGIGLNFVGKGFYSTDYGDKPSEISEKSPTNQGGCCPCGKNQGGCKS